MELQEQSVGVYPPSFCNWRLLLTVMVITEVSVVLVGLGRGGLPGWQWLGMASIHSQWMALFCASGLCVTNGWTSRLSARGAWIGSWLIAMWLAMAIQLCGLAGGFCIYAGHDQRHRWHVCPQKCVCRRPGAVVFFRYL